MTVHCAVPLPSGRWEIDVTQAPLPLRRSLSRPRSARAILLLSAFFQYITQQDHAPYLISSFPSSFLYPLSFSFPQSAADRTRAKVEEQKKRAHAAAERAEKEANRLADQAKHAKSEWKASAKKAESALDDGIDHARGIFGGIKDFFK